MTMKWWKVMKRVPIRALLFGLSLFAALPADAAPECLKNDNPCQPDKLCSFKAALAEKVLLYQLYLRNSQVTKRRGSREGVRYDGDLYDTSMSEAQTAFPKETAAQQRVRAGQIFQEKIRKYASDHFKLPACKTGSVDLSLFPKKGYSGMNTNEACQVWVNFEGGEYDPATFGSSDQTTCKEFYDRDRAHEVIHQRRCEAAKKRGQAHTFDIDETIEEEIVAYRHSVRLTQAYVRLLSLQCSTQATPDELRKRAQNIENLLTPYFNK